MGTITRINKYCFISPEYPPETGFGGIGTYVWHMARVLASNGIDVTIFSYSTEKDKTYLEDGIKVVRKKIKKFQYLLWYIRVILFLAKNRFDVIEDADFSGSTFLYQLFYRRRRDFIHVKLHTCHKIIYYFENRRSFFQRITTSILDFIASYVTRNADLITSPSNTVKQMTGLLWNLPEHRIEPLAHPFSILTSDYELKAIQGDYILYFGRLQELKGAKLILELCKKDFLKDLPWKLILIGRDIYNFKAQLAEMDNKTVKKVEMINHMHDKKLLFSYIKSARAVFLPSKFESFGFTMLESLWFNPKTFVLNNSGPLEIMTSLGLHENILDECILMDNPQYLASKILKKDYQDVEAIRKKINVAYGYDAIANKLIKIIKSTNK